MKKASRIFFQLVIFSLLTMITQIGGLVYLLFLVLQSRVKASRLVAFGIFVGLYTVFTFLLIPFLAPYFGREPLPMSGKVRPTNILTCILNRHYVSSVLKKELIQISEKVGVQFPGTTLNYLDANFPFFNGFPLLPHLSHNDGKKLDLAFYYHYKQNSEETNKSPSFIGYGAFEGPNGNEINYPERCLKDGYLMYNMLGVISPFIQNEKYELDEARTRALVKLLAGSSNISKIFIEPHLKTRWKLEAFNKIRFQGCHSVRHDDHIHLQIF